MRLTKDKFMAGLDAISGKAYMVVDDSAVMRRIVKQCLLRFGVGEDRICEAGDGDEAIALLATKKVDCILADWNMPNCDGLTLLKKVRTLPNHQHTPFIMLTTENSRESVLEAIRTGVSAYLVKPISPEILQKRLGEVFA